MYYTSTYIYTHRHLTTTPCCPGGKLGRKVCTGGTWVLGDMVLRWSRDHQIGGWGRGVDAAPDGWDPGVKGRAGGGVAFVR